MLEPRLLLLLILLVFYSNVNAQTNPHPRPLPSLTCIKSASIPGLDECFYLTNSIGYVARQPGGSTQKTYGPNLESNDTSYHLPKTFWVGIGTPPEPINCEFLMTYNPRETFPDWDEFSFLSVAIVAQRLTTKCLAGSGSIGYDFPGKFLTCTQWMRPFTPFVSSSNSTAAATDDPGVLKAKPWTRMWNVTLDDKTFGLYESDEDPQTAVPPIEVLNEAAS